MGEGMIKKTHSIANIRHCNNFYSPCNICDRPMTDMDDNFASEIFTNQIVMKKAILYALYVLLAAIGVQAQNITVHGTVFSKTDDEPLIGASVMSEGTKAATATDLDGNFTISVPEGSKLNVSYVGYVTATVEAQPTVTVFLSEDSEILDEVVVVGYSSEKKSDLTGSVAVVKMKDVSDTPTGNVIQSLQGRVAGMNITTDGTPGGLSTGTSIRGASSFRGEANGPL